MAMGALAYGIKKKQDSKKQDENNERQSPLEKKTMPLLSSAKGQYSILFKMNCLSNSFRQSIVGHNKSKYPRRR
jgi:hypothetical protein